MNLPWNKPKWYYTTHEIKVQKDDLLELFKQREKLLQLSIVTKSNVKQQVYLEELDRLDDTIAICQETLNYMLDYNLRKMKRVGK